MNATNIQLSEYAEFYGTYIKAVSTEYSLVEELEISVHRFIKFVQDIPMDKFDYRYAEGKWTIKDIIQHLIDSERIFAYRALRIARNDQTPLPGFEENAYAAVAKSDQRNVQSLLTEFSTVRQSNIFLFKGFSDEELFRIGTASGKQISVRALGVIIVGHQNHHQRIFEERYL